MAGMPAARKPASAGLVDYLNSQAPRLDVSNSLAISSYFRALDSLLTQVGCCSCQSFWHQVQVLRCSYILLSQIALYRSERNEEQLYVMLLRYIRCVPCSFKVDRVYILWQFGALTNHMHVELWSQPTIMPTRNADVPS